MPVGSVEQSHAVVRPSGEARRRRAPVVPYEPGTVHQIPWNKTGRPELLLASRAWMNALEGRMQQLHETVRRALTPHDTFQVRLLRPDLTRTRHAWDVLCSSRCPGTRPSRRSLLRSPEPPPAPACVRPDPSDAGLHI